MPKWEKEIFLSCIYFTGYVLQGRDILGKKLFYAKHFWTVKCQSKEHTELQLKDEIRLKLCMFKNSLHQSQEGLRRLKEIPKLQSFSCEENILHCARRLTCNANVIIAL